MFRGGVIINRGACRAHLGFYVAQTPAPRGTGAGSSSCLKQINSFLIHRASANELEAWRLRQCRRHAQKSLLRFGCATRTRTRARRVACQASRALPWCAVRSYNSESVSSGQTVAALNSSYSCGGILTTMHGLRGRNGHRQRRTPMQSEISWAGCPMCHSAKS